MSASFAVQFASQLDTLYGVSEKPMALNMRCMFRDGVHNGGGISKSQLTIPPKLFLILNFDCPQLIESD